MKNVIASLVALRVALICVLSGYVPPAFALDPVLDVSQYAHTAWKIRDGFSKGTIRGLAQTPDGYLWLGTEFGLLRFDGVRNVAWQPPAGMSLPDVRVRVLLATRDGTLWIGTWQGLASWSGRKLVTYPKLSGRFVNALVEDREGAVWVSAASLANALLCKIQDGQSECYGEDGSLGARIASLYEDSKGALWVANGDRLWRWKPGAPVPHFVSEPVGLQGLSETASGGIVVLTRDGLREVVDGKVAAFRPAGMPEQFQADGLMRDRHGATWIGTRDAGLLHVHDGRTDSYGHSDGLSGGWVTRLFEDREGNVWTATLDGIDRFRALSATTYSSAQGLADAVQSVIAGNDGSVWLSTVSGLKRWHEGRIDNVIAEGLPRGLPGAILQDHRGRIWLGMQTGFGYVDDGRFVRVHGVPDRSIDAIAEDRDGNIWFTERDAGLFKVSADRTVQQIAWTRISQRGYAWRLTADPVNGGLWLGFFSGGVAHFVDGQVAASYTPAEGLTKGRVNDLGVAPDGVLWVATDGGLSRVKAGRIATLDSKSGLPCDAVDSTIVDDDGALWIYTACGLVRILASDLHAWTASVDKNDAPKPIPTTVLDSSDGVRSLPTPITGSLSPHLAKSLDGKLWLATYDGVTVVDPHRLYVNGLPPPVHVEEIIADRRTYDGSSLLRLPPRVRDLQINYTAPSLVAPEKNLFRYKLEGRDRDWQDVGNRRQAFYSDLGPGNYRFRVIASNNSGVWNEEGATLDFSIAPAYWQTNWFRALCVLAFMALLWALYRLRLRQIAQGFNARLEERVGERTRIARDLHDTLLQSFQGLLLRFQTVYEMLPPTAAKEALGSAIDQTEQAIIEGRDAVQGLRASTVETNDLAVAITRLGEELAVETGGQTAAGMRVEVEGVPRRLQPIVRDEVYRIASEALRNAFRHAGAKQIEVELRYDPRQLRLRIRDDGKGIAPELLTAGGRVGHFGLHGMRERAKLMGGKMTVWTAPGAGTEIDLGVPAAHAYVASPTPARSWLAEKFSRKSAKVDS